MDGYLVCAFIAVTKAFFLAVHTGYVDNIKELEQLLKDMRKDLEQKYLDIELKKDKIRKLQKEVKDREEETKDKNEINGTLKEDKYSNSDN